MRSHGAIQLACVIIFSTGPLLDCQSFFACDNTGADRMLGTDVFISQTPRSDNIDRLPFFKRRHKLGLVHHGDSC